MAEGILMGAALGAGGAALSGNDMVKGAALGGAMGGATAGFGGAGVTSGAAANAGSQSMMQTLATPTMTSGATAAVGNTMNPALTNGMGQSSNALTQFGRDAGSYMSDMGSNISDTVGQGFDYMNDMTGMENKDWTKMGLNQGAQLMQPDPQQQLQAAPMGQGISRPQVDLSQSPGSLLSSNPLTSGPGGRQMTQKDYELLKQGLL
jgi:hypothetical protein